MSFDVKMITSQLAQAGKKLEQWAKMEKMPAVTATLRDFHNLYTGYAGLLNYYGNFLSSKSLEKLPFTDAEKKTMAEYRRAIEDLLTSMHHENLFEDLLDDTLTNPMQALEKVQGRLEKNFTTYEKKLSAIALLEDNMNAIGEKYKNSDNLKKLKIKDPKTQQFFSEFFNPSASTVTTKPTFAFLTQYPYRFTKQVIELLEAGRANLEQRSRIDGDKPELRQATASINTTLNLMERIKSNIDVQRAVNLSALQVRAPENLTKAILDFDLKFSTKEKMVDEATFAVCFDVYLKNLLANAYPSIFTSDATHDNTRLSSSSFVDRSELSQYAIIKKALGMIQSQESDLNPSKFDIKRLDSLFAQDKNPLWLALKSTIPVSDTYPAEDKINNYIALAGEFYNRKITDKDKYKGALDMADAAANVVAEAKAAGAGEKEIAHLTELVSKAFIKEPALNNAASPNELAKKGQFAKWIVEKDVKERSIHKTASRSELSDRLMRTMSESSDSDRYRRSASTSSLSSIASSASFDEPDSPAPSEEEYGFPEALQAIFKKNVEEEGFGFPEDLSIISEENEKASLDAASSHATVKTQSQFKQALTALKESQSRTNHVNITFHNQTIPLTLEHIDKQSFPHLFASGTPPLLDKPNGSVISNFCNQLLTQLEEQCVTPGKETKFRVDALTLSASPEEEDTVNLLVEFSDNNGTNTFISYSIDANTGTTNDYDANTQFTI